jgi:16S rRNA (guanine966-N2)-methyltransferase
VTRIVAGVAGGRRLAVPPGRRTRPTSERAREGLFSSLGDLDDARFLDLYAGSGAVGLEALSRGAATATLVEQDAGALRVLRANAAALGLPGADIRAGSVDRFLDQSAESAASDEPTEPYDIVFLDPPYALAIDPVLRRCLPLVADLVVVERATRDGPPTWPDAIEGGKVRRYGDTALWYGRRS